MKTTERFDTAVTKLYKAFSEDKLDPMDCAACAVGNLCDNTNDWVSSHDANFGELARIKENFNNQSSYSQKELAIIECLFLYGTKDIKQKYKFTNTKSKDLVKTHPKYTLEAKENNFLGLCAVIEYLCELDNIPNVLDHTRMFQEELVRI